MKHIKPTSLALPLSAQDGGGAFEDALKALFTGIFWGVNPIFLFFTGQKFSNN